LDEIMQCCDLFLPDLGFDTFYLFGDGIIAFLLIYLQAFSFDL
jgi:hypothetical protein